MLDKILKSKWVNLTVQLILFTLLSSGSYYASQYILHLADNIVLESLAVLVFLLGGVGCVCVSVFMDDKYSELNNLTQYLNNNNKQEK